MPIPPLTVLGLKDGTPANETDSTIPLNELRDAINDMLAGNRSWEQLNFGAQSLTIATGAVTATYSYIVVDTEGAAATDDLTTINGGSDGDVLYIRSANAGRVVTLKSGVGNVVLSSGDTVLSPTSILALFRVGTVWYNIIPLNVSLNPITDPGVFNARLTTQSGKPIMDGSTTTDIYLAAYNGNVITLYNGSQWVNYTITEVSASLSGKSSDNVYDLFVYDSGGGVLALAFSTAFSSGTSRATALGKQDGVYVKSSDHTRRWVGTIHINNGTGQVLDQANKRGIWNLYNQVQKYVGQTDATGGAYTTATWRAWGGGGFDVTVVSGLVNGDMVAPRSPASMTCSWGTTAQAGFGLQPDWVSGAPSRPYALKAIKTSATGQYHTAAGGLFIDTGRHVLSPLQIGAAAITFVDMEYSMEWWC